MPMRSGSSLVTKAYLGATQVKKAYRGASLVADYSGTPARAFIRDAAVSYQSVGGTATTETVTRPTNYQVGDLLLLVVISDEGTAATHTPPTGFTHPTGTAEAVGGTGRAVVSISQKVAAAGEPTSYTLAAFDTTGDGIAVMYAIGNVGAAADTRVNAASSVTSATLLTSPTVTPVTAKGLNLRGVAQDSGGGVVWTPGAAPSGYTLLRSDTHSLGYIWAATYLRDYDSTAATGTQDFTFTNAPSNNRVGVGWNVVIPSA